MKIENNSFEPLMDYNVIEDQQLRKTFELGDMELQLYIVNKSKKSQKRYKRKWRNAIKGLVENNYESKALKIRKICEKWLINEEKEKENEL